MSNLLDNKSMAEPRGEDEPKKRRRLVDIVFAPWMKEYSDSEDNWQQDVHRAYVEQKPLRARALVYGIAIVTLGIIVWANFAEIDEVTRGTGKVIPSRKIQVIQSQDGGIVTELLVREGDTVEVGQLLVSLDQTRSRSSFRENRAEFQALSVKEARLRAVAEKTSFEPDPEMMKVVPKIVAEEIALFESSQTELRLLKQISSQQLKQRREELEEVTVRERQLARSRDLTVREMSVTRPMVASGAVSQVEILRLEREVNQLTGDHAQSQAQLKRIKSAIEEAERKLENVEIEFISAVREELADTITALNSLRELGTGLSHRVDQDAVRSPVNGVVQSVFFNTIGGVVLPGRDIIEIVPSDDTLLLEVDINPKDIAFLIPGQPALVKFTAYDFAVYGSMKGTVEHISADTVENAEGKPHYRVKVRTKQSILGDDKPIIPGMTVTVDILTGKKSIMAYLLRPLTRAKQIAMTER